MTAKNVSESGSDSKVSGLSFEAYQRVVAFNFVRRRLYGPMSSVIGDAITEGDNDSTERPAKRLIVAKPRVHNRPDPVRELVIIGIDAEWFEVNGRNIVLSYQIAGRHRGKQWSGIYFTRPARKIVKPTATEKELAKIRIRVPLGDLLAAAIQKGLNTKVLREWPAAVIVCCHWSRSDLSAMADFAAIKKRFDNAQKTYVTTGRPYEVRRSVGGHTHRIVATLRDTRLLAPGTSKGLEALGRLYDFPKIEVGDYIEQMDKLLADDLQLFTDYAIRDAEISARHVEEITRFAIDELSLPPGKIPATLGSIAVSYLLQRWKDSGIDTDAVNGVKIDIARVFSREKRRYTTKKHSIPVEQFKIHEAVANAAFHGGRNECFWYGPTPKAAYQEFDLQAAYTTAMTTIGMPDYAAAYNTTNVAEFTAGDLGFARVCFQFPAGTRYPSLPVVATDTTRGLIYPRGGRCYATAAEIAVARHLGADLQIEYGVVVPWQPGGLRPFELVIRDLLERRARHASGTLPNEMLKQMANSLYGKTCQGIAGIEAFNTRDGDYEEVGPSPITNAYLAAYITGLVRAAISELITTAGRRGRVVSVTTDGFITDAKLEDLEMSGPVCSFLATARQQLAGSDELIEPKYAAVQLLPWRTRGITTLERGSANLPPKLARGGMREPEDHQADPHQWFARSMLTRQPGNKWSTREPPPFAEAHRKNLDFVFAEKTRRVNFEYDFKRRPVDPAATYVQLTQDHIAQHIAFDTVPWERVEEFDAERDTFERWRRMLKHIKDWRTYQDYRAGEAASKAGIRRSTGGPVNQARKLFIRAYVAKAWGLPGDNYATAAKRLSEAGYRTREMDFKNARRRMKGDPPEGVILADTPGVSEFIAAISNLWPEFEWRRMIAGSGMAPATTTRKLIVMRDWALIAQGKGVSSL